MMTEPERLLFSTRDITEHNLVNRDACVVRLYIFLWDSPDCDGQDPILSLAPDFANISIFWKLNLALKCTKASLLLLLSPIDIHLLLLALTAHNQPAVFVYLYLHRATNTY